MSTDEIKISGFRQLCFAAIPWVLACGCSAWLAFYWGVHNTRKDLSQEDRMAIYVGAEHKPKAKMIIEDKSDGCVTLQRAEFDGSTLLMYAQNNCPNRINSMFWQWELMSPDNTALKNGIESSGCPMPIEPKDKAECKLDILSWPTSSAEDRATRIVVRLSGYRL